MADEQTTDTTETETSTEETTATTETTEEVVDLASATAETKEEVKEEVKEETKEEPVVPETYELKLTTTNEAGEEIATDLDPALVEVATPLLKDVGLTNDAANKLLPLVPKIQERLIAQQAETFETTKADWAKETQADPEIGGKNWKETSALVAKALDHYAGGAEKNEDGTYKSGFRQLLVDSGLTNHPDMARLLRSVGADRAEDGTLPRSEAKAVKKSPEEENYPDDVPKK